MCWHGTLRKQENAKNFTKLEVDYLKEEKYDFLPTIGTLGVKAECEAQIGWKLIVGISSKHLSLVNDSNHKTKLWISLQGRTDSDAFKEISTKKIR